MNGMKGVVSGKLESLKSLIPGHSGREGIGLDEVDGEFRLHLSEKVMRGMERMEEIKKEFSEDGKVVILAPMAKSIGRLSSLGAPAEERQIQLQRIRRQDRWTGT